MREGILLYHKIQQIMGIMSKTDCVHRYIKFTKNITSLTKKGGHFVCSDWRFLCYWETALGFQPYQPIETLAPDVEEWLVNEKKNGELIGEDNFFGFNVLPHL